MYQRKNGTWCDTVPQGKGKPPKFFYGKSKTEVKKKISEYKEKQDLTPTLSEAAEAWEEDHRAQVRESSMRQYSVAVDKLKNALGEYRIGELQPAQIQAYWNQLSEKRFAMSTISTQKVVLSMIYNYMILKPDSKIKYNPVTATRLPTGARKGFRDIPARSVIETIRASVDVDFGLFPFLLIFTGCRRGEALALTDKDFTSSTVSISKSVTWDTDGKPQITEPKTKAANRSVILLPPLKDALPKWEGFLFSVDGGKTPLTQPQYYRLWLNYCKETDLVHRQAQPSPKRPKATQWVFDVTPHQLRHEYATICFDAGIDAKDAAKLLGHTTEEMTRNIYTHITQSREELTAKKLADYVTKAY